MEEEREITGKRNTETDSARETKEREKKNKKKVNVCV